MSVEWTKQNILPARDKDGNGSAIVPFIRDMKFLWEAVEDRGGTDRYDGNVVIRAETVAQSIVSRWYDSLNPFVVSTDAIEPKWNIVVDQASYWRPRRLKDVETMSTVVSKLSKHNPILLDSVRRMFHDVKRMRMFFWDATFDSTTLHTSETSGGDDPPTPTAGSPYKYDMYFRKATSQEYSWANWVKSEPSSGVYTITNTPSHASSRDRSAYLVMHVVASGWYTAWASGETRYVIDVDKKCAIPVQCDENWNVSANSVSSAVSLAKSHYNLIEPSNGDELGAPEHSNGSYGAYISVIRIVPVAFIDEETDIWDIGWDWEPSENGGGGI